MTCFAHSIHNYLYTVLVWAYSIKHLFILCKVHPLVDRINIIFILQVNAGEAKHLYNPKVYILAKHNYLQQEGLHISLFQSLLSGLSHTSNTFMTGVLTIQDTT